MNSLLNSYCVNVDSPDVCGAEHLETLYIRDRLEQIKFDFNDDEKTLLESADYKLLKNANKIYLQVSCFVNLKEERKMNFIDPQYWWWYLDKLNQPPVIFLHHQDIFIFVDSNEFPEFRDFSSFTELKEFLVTLEGLELRLNLFDLISQKNSSPLSINWESFVGDLSLLFNYEWF